MAIPITETIIEALKEEGMLDREKLAELFSGTDRTSHRLNIKTLVEKELVRQEDLLRVLSVALKIPPIDISRISPDKELLKCIPEKVIRSHLVFPLACAGNYLSLAVYDPTDILALDDIKSITGKQIKLLLSTKKGIESAIRSFYEDPGKDMSRIISEDAESDDVEIMTGAQNPDAAAAEKESSSAPIVKMVSLLINEAIRKRASDIHIEPDEKKLRIRYRVDGGLLKAFDIPKKNENAVLARLKIMSGLDITENRVPQDGRFRIKYEEKFIDFRVSTLPLIHGNKMVLRALDKSNLSVGLESLGFLPEPLADFKKALESPYGIILVTGPTGSGKSTTLYSVLNKMNTPEKSIITVEDPVEYQVEGITQIAARPEIGLTFADGLRAILRQSPDVIMVGEIRDYETADIAVKASLTGQMVLSTLHTNDSVGVITRLANMGVEPFLIASSLVMACAQRLFRSICPDCRIPDKIAPEVLEKIRNDYPEARDVTEFYKGEGCPSCSKTGYRGRFGTLETLLIDDTLKEMIYTGKSESDIRRYLKDKGVRTLRDNAMRKFISGRTTLEEVYRVT